MILREQRSQAIGERLKAQWERNYLGNKEWLLQQYKQLPPPIAPFYPKIAKRTDFRPVMCVGAGPSLDRNIRQLDPKLYDIVACDKTVPKLAEIGITPTYIVALNAAETDVRNWLQSAVNKSKLVMPIVAHPEAREGWDKENVIFVNNCTITEINDRVEVELGMPSLVIGSNAGTFSYLWAVYTYHNPVAYIGMDFSFLSRTAVLNKQDPRHYTVIEMTDINEEARFLDLGWFDMAQAYQEWVRFYLEQYGIRTVNCTEGGINYSQYTEAMRLGQYNKQLKKGGMA